MGITGMRDLVEWLDVVDKDWEAPPPDYDDFFDYEIMEICKYPVACLGAIDGVSDCGEAATYWVWWREYGKGMHVCAEHLEAIKKVEEND